MQLGALIADLETLKVEGTLQAEVTGLAYEARRVVPGNLYVALQREFVDGHGEIALAAERGAVGVVCRKNGAMRQRATVVEVADTRAALADLAPAFYDQPGDKLRVVGVAGRGAWKTAFLLVALLRRSGVRTGLISSVRHEVGERRLPAGASLEGSDVHRLFGEMVRAGCGTCVIELPELSVGALRGIPLDVLVHAGGDLNLWKVSEYMRCSTARKPACGILNLDGKEEREAAFSVLFDAHVTFGLSSSAQVSIQDVGYSEEATSGTFYLGNRRLSLDLEMAGADNLRHFLAAAAAAFACDLTPEEILAATIDLRSPPGSLERVVSASGFSVFVDEARDAASLEAALRCLREISGGRILLAFGSSEKTAGKERFEMGRVAARYAQGVILTSDNPGREPVEQICSVIAQGIETAGQTAYRFIPDRAEAIAALVEMAEEGDVLVIAGKGERTWQEFANTVVPFDDRQVVAEWLERQVKLRTPVARRILVPA